jgi:hypothetical protein
VNCKLECWHLRPFLAVEEVTLRFGITSYQRCRAGLRKLERIKGGGRVASIFILVRRRKFGQRCTDPILLGARQQLAKDSVLAMTLHEVMSHFLKLVSLYE